MLFRAYKVVQFSVDIEADSYEEAEELAKSIGHAAYTDEVEIELQVDEVEDLG